MTQAGIFQWLLIWATQHNIVFLRGIVLCRSNLRHREIVKFFQMRVFICARSLAELVETTACEVMKKNLARGVTFFHMVSALTGNFVVRAAQNPGRSLKSNRSETVLTLRIGCLGKPLRYFSAITLHWDQLYKMAASLTTVTIQSIERLLMTSHA